MPGPAGRHRAACAAAEVRAAPTRGRRVQSRAMGARRATPSRAPGAATRVCASARPGRSARMFHGGISAGIRSRSRSIRRLRRVRRIMDRGHQREHSARRAREDQFDRVAHRRGDRERPGAAALLLPFPLEDAHEDGLDGRLSAQSRQNPGCHAATRAANGSSSTSLSTLPILWYSRRVARSR